MGLKTEWDGRVFARCKKDMVEEGWAADRIQCQTAYQASYLNACSRMCQKPTILFVRYDLWGGFKCVARCSLTPLEAIVGGTCGGCVLPRRSTTPPPRLSFSCSNFLMMETSWQASSTYEYLWLYRGCLSRLPIWYSWAPSSMIIWKPPKNHLGHLQ